MIQVPLQCVFWLTSPHSNMSIITYPDNGELALPLLVDYIGAEKLAGFLEK